VALGRFRDRSAGRSTERRSVASAGKMAAKVAARHAIDEDLDALVMLNADGLARFLDAAGRAVVRLTQGNE